MKVERASRERAADRMMKRVTGGVGEVENKRDKQMNRGEETQRETDKSNRNLQPCEYYKEVLCL